MREGFKCREPCSCFDTFIWGCIRRKMNRVDSKCEYNSEVFRIQQSKWVCECSFPWFSCSQNVLSVLLQKTHIKLTAPWLFFWIDGITTNIKTPVAVACHPEREKKNTHTHTHTQTHQKQIGSFNTYLTRHHVKWSEVRHSVLWHCGRCIFFIDFLLFFGEHLFDGPPMWPLKWLPILMQNSIRICYSTHQRPLKSRALRILWKSLLQQRRRRRRIQYWSPKTTKNPLAPQPSGREETDICVKYP